MATEQAKRGSDRVSGVSNVAYDLVTVLQNKLEGVAAMEMYKKDAEQARDGEVLDLLKELERREAEDIERLKAIVSKRLS